MATTKQAQSKQKAVKEPDKKGADRNTADDRSELTEKLDSLSEVLANDVSSVEPEGAFALIDEWHTLVQSSKGAEFKEVASGLKELQKLLKQDDAAHEMGELLSHLGTQTTEMAADADKGIKRSLKHLGKQLSKVGMSLTKEDDRNHLEELGSLLESLDQDVEEIDSKSSMDDIDRWTDLLHKSDEDGLKSIAKDLKELKRLLKGSKTKGSEISEKLIGLGEQTTEAASMANRGFKGAIKALGKSLTKLGESIEQAIATVLDEID